jgi:hypothetical protein
MVGSRLLAGLLAFCVLYACGASEKEVRPTGAEPLARAAGSGGQGGAAAGGASPGEGGIEVLNGAASDVEFSAPTLDGGRYVFRVGELELAVDPSIGGRVTRFSLGGTNVLTGPEVVASGDGSLPNMFGSTFWTSPQSDWGWPPEEAIDSAAHRARLDGAVLELVSEPGATTGYAVRKRVWMDAGRQQVTLEYVLENRRATLPAAPWEISRVPKEGLVFFPARSPTLGPSTLESTLLDGVAWLDIAHAPAGDSKLFQDGSEGWLAYVHRDLAFIKTFDDIARADQASGEAEIEVFVSGAFDYVEIEQQGRLALPPRGGSSRWRVGWLLRRLPPEVAVSVGNAALVSWVRGVLSGSR